MAKMEIEKAYAGDKEARPAARMSLEEAYEETGPDQVEEVEEVEEPEAESFLERIDENRARELADKKDYTALGKYIADCINGKHNG